MVTTPSAAVGSQVRIESGYRSCGARPGISTECSTILGSSTVVSTSSCNGYLIKTDGSSRRMVEPKQFNMITTYEGYHLSGDGSRVYFKNRSYVYPNEWYNMTVGVFDRSLWPNEVPRITNVTYPSDMYTKLANNVRFDVSIGVSDPQGANTIDNIKRTMLFPDGYEDRGGAGPIQISSWTPVQIDLNLYTTQGYRGTSWPDSDSDDYTLCSRRSGGECGLYRYLNLSCFIYFSLGHIFASHFKWKNYSVMSSYEIAFAFFNWSSYD